MPTAAGRTDLGPHLSIFRGHINVGIVRDGNRAILIDCGDGRVARALRQMGVSSVERVLFTHHHRDQACGAQSLAAGGVEQTKLIVPAGEKACFDNVESYWLSPKSRWHLYDFHPHHLMLAESVAVDGTVADGQTIQWGPATIRILATPGHTDGSVSYLIEADGQRVVFCGDAIYDRGQVWDIHSLQKGVGTSDYHGFLGARRQLAASLGAILAARPEAIVPSHGAIIADPPGAIDLLLRRLEECYDAYVAISALRHYFPKLFAEYAGREGHMAIGAGKPVPSCLRHVGTSWILISRSKAALVMDCGGRNVIAAVQKMQASGEISAVEGLWITHYHDDHVDAAAEFLKTFRCPCIADEHAAAVIGEPSAWRLPCISPVKVKVDRPTRDGESWQWHEFRLSAYHLPGQTFYHGGLLAETGGLRMLFAGDSFTMAGIDDYCAGNRNWLGEGVGFDRCVELVQKLRPTHIFNAHVDVAFEFTPEQCRHMRRNLARRLELYGRLMPWDHPNYGMDESWVRCRPYEQAVQPGRSAGLEAVITNHSAGPQTAFCRAVAPRAWGASPGPWVRATVRPKAEKGLALSVHVPPDARPGRYIIPVDVRYGRWDLPQFAEAVLVL